MYLGKPCFVDFESWTSAFSCTSETYVSLTLKKADYPPQNVASQRRIQTGGCSPFAKSLYKWGESSFPKAVRSVTPSPKKATSRRQMVTLNPAGEIHAGNQSWHRHSSKQMPGRLSTASASSSLIPYSEGQMWTSFENIRFLLADLFFSGSGGVFKADAMRRCRLLVMEWIPGTGKAALLKHSIGLRKIRPLRFVYHLSLTLVQFCAYKRTHQLRGHRIKPRKQHFVPDSRSGSTRIAPA